MRVEITIGWTRSDPEHNYSSFLHGYRPGAGQYTETMEVEVVDARDVHLIAESAFVATNHPEPDVLTGVAGQIFETLQERGFNGSQSGHYSLSVGDTVTLGEVMLACDTLGWKQVRAMA